MLMFLGEYFKAHIKQGEIVSNNVAKNEDKGPRELDKFYITFDILN